jgi:hypothetical protein
MTESPLDRFDKLLRAMVGGEPPTAGKKAATQSASSPDGSDDCDETQTPPDTSEDASR